jgi:two-component system cell cycle response regulator
VAASSTTPITQRFDRWPAEPCGPLPERFLVCLTGPEIAHPVSLEREETVLGRTADCDLTLNGAGVSRRHCVLHCEPARAVLEDLGSTNGTLLNDAQLSARERRELRSGDVIRVGDVALKYLERDDIEARYHAAVFRLMGVDALTQLKNRRFLLEQLDREIARADRHERRLSIVSVDVDRFKEINDTHGHLAGDAALQEVGALLGRSTRREDCVGRLGGDEFLVLLPETSTHGASLFAERLCKRVARDEFVHGGQRVPLTISAGVATWASGMDGPHGLLEAADQALYAAKRAGRSRAVTSD